MTRAGIAIAVVALIAAGCDRDLVPAPRARHDARDDADARRLEAQLAALPGVARASVVVHRPFHDPLAPAAAAPGPATASILVVTTGGDPARLEPAAHRLAAAALPDLPPAELRVELAAASQAPVATAAVGPFVVAAGSRGPLRATLAIALALIAALAGTIAVRERARLRRAGGG